MNFSSNQIGLTQATVYDISAADLAGANSGQRPDLLAKTQAIYRTPDSATYSANAARNQLVPVAVPLGGLGFTPKQTLVERENNRLLTPIPFDFGTIGSNASFVQSGGGSGTLETVNNQYGARTALINVGTTAGAYTRLRRNAGVSFPNMDIDGSPFVFVVEILSGFQEGDTFSFVVSSDGFVSKALTVAFSFRMSTRIHGNFYAFTAPASDFSVTGGMTWAETVNYFHADFKCNGTTGGQARFLGAFRYGTGRAKVIIEFDDNFISQYTQAFPYMGMYGLPGTVAVIKDRVGTAGYCTKAQLDDMAGAGWGMVVHGDFPHNSLTRDQLLADVRSNRDYVAQNWPDGTKHYVYPAGVTATFSKSVLAELGFSTGRTTINGLQSTHYGVDDPLCLWSLGIAQSTGVAAILARVDAAIAAGTTVRLNGHEIVQTITDATNQMTIADFRTLIDGIAQRVRDQKIDAVTVPFWAKRCNLA